MSGNVIEPRTFEDSPDCGSTSKACPLKTPSYKKTLSEGLEAQDLSTEILLKEIKGSVHTKIQTMPPKSRKSLKDCQSLTVKNDKPHLPKLIKTALNDNGPLKPSETPQLYPDVFVKNSGLMSGGMVYVHSELDQARMSQKTKPDEKNLDTSAGKKVRKKGKEKVILHPLPTEALPNSPIRMGSTLKKNTLRGKRPPVPELLKADPSQNLSSKKRPLTQLANLYQPTAYLRNSVSTSYQSNGKLQHCRLSDLGLPDNFKHFHSAEAGQPATSTQEQSLPLIQQAPQSKIQLYPSVSDGQCLIPPTPGVVGVLPSRYQQSSNPFGAKLCSIDRPGLPHDSTTEVPPTTKAVKVKKADQQSSHISGCYQIDVSDNSKTDQVQNKLISAPLKDKRRCSILLEASMNAILVKNKKVLISTENDEEEDVKLSVATKDQLSCESSRTPAGHSSLLSHQRRKIDDCSIIEQLIKRKRGQSEYKCSEFFTSTSRPCPQFDMANTPDLLQEPSSQDYPTSCDTLYRRVPWLTGQPSTSNFLCWPCLIFEDEFCKNRWSLPFGEKMEYFWEEIKKHQASPIHIASFVQLKYHEGLVHHSHEVIEEKTETSQEQSKMLKLLTQVIFTKKMKLGIEGSTSGGTSFLFENELMNLAVSYDEELNATLGRERPTTLEYIQGFVKAKYADVMLSMVDFMKKQIIIDIISAPFVALMYLNCTTNFGRSILAVVVRYVTVFGEICERFVEFIEVDGCCTAESLMEIHSMILNEFNISKKMIGFTYNGRVLSPTEQMLFHERLGRKEVSKFFHHHTFQFGDTLLESFSHLNSCRIILHTVFELTNFLEVNIEATTHLEKEGISMYNKADFSSMSGIIKILVENYTLMMRFLLGVSLNTEDWRFPVQYTNFYVVLKDAKSCFLLLSLAYLLKATEGFNVAVECNNIVAFSTYKEKALSFLKDLKQNGFEMICQRASNLLNDYKGESKDLLTNTNKQILIDLVDAAAEFISCHCNKEEAEFKCRDYNIAQLEQQLALYNSSPIFEDATINQSLEHIAHNNLTEILPELVRLLQFLLTIPGRDIDSSYFVHAPARLHVYLKKITQWNSHEAILAIENDYIRSLEKKQTFYHDIVSFLQR